MEWETLLTEMEDIVYLSMRRSASGRTFKIRVRHPSQDALNLVCYVDAVGDSFSHAAA